MERIELIKAVREVIVTNPERHNQRQWVSNVFGDGEQADEHLIPVTELRRFASEPLPEAPENPGNPVYGTVACVAGWTVILGSDGAVRNNSNYVLLPSDKSRMTVFVMAQGLLGLDFGEADWLFSSRRTRSEIVFFLDGLIEREETG